MCAQTCTVLCQTGKAKSRWGKGKKKPLNQNANNLYINTLKILLLKRAGSRRKPLLFKTGSISKCFLKIIREVQTTKGTLLLANWKLACASEGMTDFHPVVGQPTSHVSLRYRLLPTDTASPSPNPTATRLQWALSAVTCSNPAWVFHHTVLDRLAPLLLVSNQEMFRRWILLAMDGDLGTCHISGRAVACQGHAVEWCGPGAGPGCQCMLFGLMKVAFSMRLSSMKVTSSRNVSLVCLWSEGWAEPLQRLSPERSPRAGPQRLLLQLWFHGMTFSGDTWVVTCIFPGLLILWSSGSSSGSLAPGWQDSTLPCPVITQQGGFRGRSQFWLQSGALAHWHSQGQTLPQLTLVQALCQAVDAVDKGIHAVLSSLHRFPPAQLVRPDKQQRMFS